MKQIVLIILSLLTFIKINGQADIDTLYNENGKMKAIFEYKTSRKSILNGVFKRFHKNGNIDDNGTYINNKRIGLWEEYFENGQLKKTCTYNTNSDFIGEYYEYYENGNLSVSANYNSKGKETGEYLECYENENITVTGNFINGNTVGEWRYFFENGNIEQVGEYLNNNKIGLWKNYFENGNIYQTANYISPEETVIETYYENGKLEKTGTKNGKIKKGVWKEYRENGNLSEIGEYDDYNKIGLWKYFNKNNKLWTSGHYNMEGKQIGTWIEYYKDGSGKVKAEHTFNDSGTHSINYYENGNIKTKGNYVGKNQQMISGFVVYGYEKGVWEYYYENGQLAQIGNLIYVLDKRNDGFLSGDSEKDGIWKFYYKNGKLNTFVEFKKGKIWNIQNLYNDKGKPLDIGTFKNGNGLLKRYNEKGKLVKEVDFMNGKPN